MRVLLTLALAGQCSAEGREASPPAAVTSIHVETSEGATTGDEPRLDLGTWEPWTTGESTGGSTGGEDSTAPADMPTTSGATSMGEDPGTSTGEGSTSTGEDASTGAASTSGTSTGEESIGDSTTGEPLTDCPCEDGADNVCDLAPWACSATLPGGLCDPDGDGAYFDGDWNLGYTLYAEKCG